MPAPARSFMEGLAEIHEASAATEALAHVQQARAFANFLEGGEHHGGVTSEHHMDNREAADMVRLELDLVLRLMGGTPDEPYEPTDIDHE